MSRTPPPPGVAPDLFAVQRAGRGANGCERDRGRVWHAVAGGRPEDVAYGHQPALCGVAPGRRSVGWSLTVRPVGQADCPRCLKRLGVAAAPPDHDRGQAVG